MFTRTGTHYLRSNSLNSFPILLNRILRWCVWRGQIRKNTLPIFWHLQTFIQNIENVCDMENIQVDFIEAIPGSFSFLFHFKSWSHFDKEFSRYCRSQSHSFDETSKLFQMVTSPQLHHANWVHPFERIPQIGNDKALMISCTPLMVFTSYLWRPRGFRCPRYPPANKLPPLRLFSNPYWPFSVTLLYTVYITILDCSQWPKQGNI